ncbi:MAG TPA: bifunctional diaminohydroxyphosphoribosylaminopyrimidine deaminase/5-amino-6-(5-phosphoribosylamino)uracil reductase RibD [Pyrinomonadaceae bacterium]|nr:bifunctional diaminohydroxyphosphoribosylaminopyrimidine deaminase/5-amino-6-(5-phosphoribosylamino)uracil reductase RibD [Pyrinomonadaceae bacterium]
MTSTTLSAPTATWTDTDRRMMVRALELAQQGLARVSPGPLVGCVIVSATGEVVGEGFYLYEEVKHAETLALQQAGERARGGTAYVSLEPHAHHGRTPPCTAALIAAGVTRVIAPIEDLNPRVSGNGFAELRRAGIEVCTGLLADEAQKLNEKYLHFMRTGLPFVQLKLAVSLDGRIASRTGDSRWVAGEEARAQAHVLRHESDAILVGAGTAAIDNPLLTDRSQLPRRRPLVRVVLDESLRISAESQLVTTASEAPLLVLTGENADETKAQKLEGQGVEIVRSGTRDVKSVLQELSKRSLQSVLVEGGSEIAGSFIDSRLVNKATFFVAPKIIGGRSAPGAIGGDGARTMAEALGLERVEVIKRGEDIEITGYPTSRKDEG